MTSVLHVNDGETTENGGAQFGRSAGWAIGLERLLADCAGLATFTVRKDCISMPFSFEYIRVLCVRYEKGGLFMMGQLWSVSSRVTWDYLVLLDAIIRRTCIDMRYHD